MQQIIIIIIIIESSLQKNGIPLSSIPTSRVFYPFRVPTPESRVPSLEPDRLFIFSLGGEH
jgi:hypothetical protein